ncbi:MAG TPA: ribosomal protein S18-alanine N-acetyltransferase, partial [Chloroflexota bacterium]
FPFGFFRRPPRADGQLPDRTGAILGYAGMWLMLDEAHITTIAMRTRWRGKGLGELLLASLIETARDVGAHRVTLEVRVSNEPAQNLYRKYGFVHEGTRPRYYSDNNEDAYIMTTQNIQDGSYRDMFEERIKALRLRFDAESSLPVDAPAMAAADSGDAG